MRSNRMLGLAGLALSAAALMSVLLVRKEQY
jgi:hypothetical protein